MSQRVEKAVVAGDTQFPFADDATVKLFLKWIKEYNPHKVFLNGDMVDFYVLSRYKKSPLLQVRLKEEIQATKDFLRDLRRACPRAEIEWIEGNHEFRLKAFIYDNAPALAELDEIKFENLFELSKFKVTYHPLPDKLASFNHSFVEYNDFLIGHFAKVNQHGGYTAKNLVDTFGKNIVQNHTHRIGSSIRKVYDGMLEGYESGSLCGDDPVYGTFMNWAKGWGYLETVGGNTHYYQIMVKDERFVWNGRLYT